MNGYKAFYKGKQADVYAETPCEAQQKAAVLLRAKKHYDVAVVLCETNTTGPDQPGTQVAHSTAAL